MKYLSLYFWPPDQIDRVSKSTVKLPKLRGLYHSIPGSLNKNYTDFLPYNPFINNVKCLKGKYLGYEFGTTLFKKNIVTKLHLT